MARFQDLGPAWKPRRVSWDDINLEEWGSRDGWRLGSLCSRTWHEPFLKWREFLNVPADVVWSVVYRDIFPGTRSKKERRARLTAAERQLLEQRYGPDRLISGNLEASSPGGEDTVDETHLAFRPHDTRPCRTDSGFAGSVTLQIKVGNCLRASWEQVAIDLAPGERQ